MSGIRVISAVAVAWALAALFTGFWKLQRNIASAKRTGFNYVICPYNPHNPLWLTIQVPFLALLKSVAPTVMGTATLTVLTKDWAFKIDHGEIWRKLGDTFMVITPWTLIVYTRCPEAIQQITSRRDDFPKAVEQYGVLEMLGANIVTTEGAVWKMHRKVTSSLFNEVSAANAFEETVRQTQSMLRIWRGHSDDDGQDGQVAADGRTISSLAHDTMTLALNIIGTIGFGLRFLWPGEKASDNQDPRMNKYTQSEKDSNYLMTFPNATAGMLENIFAILLVPSILLRHLPFEWARSAHESNVTYVRYMRELVKDKTEDLHKGVPKTDEHMDIVGALVRAKDDQKKQQDVGKTDIIPPGLQLTDDHIISNAFIMMLAGHETSANMLHFAMTLLAAHPSSQRAMQADLDRLFPDGDEEATGWRFENCINDLLTSMPGAVLNETLRFLPPVVVIPKQVSPSRDQVLRVDGDSVEHVLPAGTIVSVTVVSAARNEKYWPPNEAGESDVHEWIPERWFRASSSSSPPPVETAQRRTGDSRAADEDVTDDEGDGLETTSAGADKPMFRPVRGLFVPFSDGARSCLGRRIARVETVTALAVVFRKYSMELAVDEWADDEAVKRMNDKERAELYHKAIARCMETLKTATSTLTLKLPKDQCVPVRVVRRGKERFVGRL
ncbi:hypothetical protein MGG_06872 [Pyricularia oryzae 70-15]|uniref:Cytochrome P450 n=1 Tax=Pyricularia oryzae (strain 70-15 / ATCC MYA-4617 / FGSC 8958) TaxID=242507 RepID=G4MMK8_PYRO7|nr:uncharacterized protein MGG_06872 [Pyricularia oryzae 70-15]EHA56986.1 hypothetical protein MGG_06872 [Pyricularia oryzae 70-15]